jgi:hypothetical protein
MSTFNVGTLVKSKHFYPQQNGVVKEISKNCNDELILKVEYNGQSNFAKKHNVKKLIKTLAMHWSTAN